MKYYYDEFLSLMEEDYRVTSIKVLCPVYKIDDEAFSSSSDTLETVDLPISIYNLGYNIFGEEHSVKVRFSGNEDLWQDDYVYKANDADYYGDVEFYARGYANLADVDCMSSEDGLTLELVHAFVEKDCVAEVKIYSFDENENKILDKTYTINLYEDDDPGYNYVMDYDLDFVPDGKEHLVSVTLYNNLTDRVQWGDVCEREFIA